jgi:hypothetical protein
VLTESTAPHHEAGDIRAFCYAEATGEQLRSYARIAATGNAVDDFTPGFRIMISIMPAVKCNFTIAGV